MKRDPLDLIYFIAETHYFSKNYSVMVVSLVGPLIKRNINPFEELVEQILKTTSKAVILNFRDVPANIDKPMLEKLEVLKKGLVELTATLKLSGVHPELRKILHENSIVQLEEHSNNLEDAIQSVLE